MESTARSAVANKVSESVNTAADCRETHPLTKSGGTTEMVKAEMVKAEMLKI
jgi:hypothetical protein